jgi:DNA-directed RNA polymerase specialized sigma24 family protein
MATSSYESIESISCRRTREALQEALQSLPNDQRVVFTLHAIEELSYCEIADMLDQPVDQVKIIYHAGREALRGWLVGVLDAWLAKRPERVTRKTYMIKAAARSPT